MRRIALPTLLAALALPASAHAAAGGTAAPRLGVRLAACQPGASVAQRAAAFEGTMPAAAGADVLAMRFDLEQRRGTTGRWKPMTGVPGFGRFERSGRGAAGFVYAKRVEHLAVGASYRVVVRFRWRDEEGATVKGATRTSPACKQPDLRPDLTVVGVRVAEPLGGGRARYVLQVRNRGASPVLGTLRVGLAVDDVALQPVALSGLPAGATAEATFDGPACAPGRSVLASIDPADVVEERNEADNALTVPCA